MTARYRIGQRVAASCNPILAKHIPEGTTGEVIALCGHCAYEVRFDGDPRPVILLPAHLAPLATDAPSQPAPSPYRFMPRGKKASVQ